MAIKKNKHKGDVELTLSQKQTRRSVEHCTPHADGAWLNELGWSQLVMKYNIAAYLWSS